MDQAGGEIMRCTECSVPIDVSQLAPFTKIHCPKCDAKLRVKSEFGPFKLVRLHAMGGMSMVFSAHDATLDREVALKILSEDYSADERRIAAFEEEARITASLSHPNVVRVFKTGRAFGRFYIAMEMVPGGHLEERIRELGKIPEEEMLPIAIEVALGLQAAHNAGLIHRDVKPGNILLDASGHARLVDFGLALVTQGGKALASEIWATPYYVPPETIEGQSEDFRSDIYAFGSSLYHALSGTPPCGAEAMSTDALREAKKKIPPLAKIEPSISPATCRLVARAMAYDPARRHSSYADLIDELRRCLALLQSGGGDHAAATAGAARGRSGGMPKWAYAAAIAAPVLLAVAFWPRQKNEPINTTGDTSETKDTTDHGDHSAAEESVVIARIHRTGREALEKRDYGTAATAFATLLANERVLEPTRSWAGIEAVLAAFLDGKDADARLNARAARAHLANLPQDHPLAAKDWLDRLAAVDAFPPLPCPESADGAAGVAAAMLAGLKNWEQGLLEKAAACFRAAAAAKLSEEESWIAIYQKCAGDYLADHGILTGPEFGQEPADHTGCEALVSRLEELSHVIKTRGRAPFNIEAWKRDLRHRALRLAVKGPQTPIGTVPPAGEVLARLRELATAWNYAEAIEYLKGFASDPEGATLQSLNDIVRAAAAFPGDLERDITAKPYIGAFTLKTGTSAVRLSVSDGYLSATAADGAEIPCKWSDIATDSLIELHRVLVKNSASDIDRLRRHECAIAFDWLVGNPERALAAARILGESNPAFKQRWERILSGLPR